MPLKIDDSKLDFIKDVRMYKRKKIGCVKRDKMGNRKPNN